MADTISFIQGSDSLVLNTGDYKVQEIDLTSGPPDALTHMPDYGENRVVRTEDKDRQATLQMRIIGADWDDVYNNITEIRRWLKEAARAEVDGDTDTVYLQLKRSTVGSTATNATNNRIRYGWVDGDSSAWTPYGQNVEQALVIFVHLVLTPYGEAATAITLKNEMFNSPHMLEESAVAGVAAGWTQAGANETIALNTNNWLIGGQSSKITTTADVEGQGINADTVTCLATDGLAAYVWVAAQADNIEDLTIVFRDGAANTIGDATFTPSAPTGYDKTISDPGGGAKIWYRYSFSDPEPIIRAAANCQLRIVRLAGDAGGTTGSYFVDGAYIHLDSAGTVPDAWMSSRNTDNRNDYQTTNQASENFLNYIDVWGIPGDAPADVVYQIKSKEPGTVGGDGPNITYLSRAYDGTYLVAEQDHWIESDEFDAEVGANWSQVATDTNGSFERFTAAGGASTGSITWNFDGEDARKLLTTRRFVTARMRSSDVAVATVYMTAKILFGLAGGSNVEVNYDTVTLVTNDTWEIVELGLINFANLFSITPPDTSNPRVQILLSTNAIGIGETFDIDNLMLHYVDHDGYSISDAAYISDEETGYFYSKDNTVVSTDTGITGFGLGTIPRLESGNVSNRVLVQYTTAGSKQYGYDGEVQITLVVTPRTRHLLGTL